MTTAMPSLMSPPLGESRRDDVLIEDARATVPLPCGNRVVVGNPVVVKLQMDDDKRLCDASEACLSASQKLVEFIVRNG